MGEMVDAPLTQETEKQREERLEELVRKLSQPENFENEQASCKWFASVVRSRLPSSVLLDMSFAIVSGTEMGVEERPLFKLEQEWRRREGLNVA